MEPVVLYEENDGIAIVAINRPGKKNTLTDEVIQGIADGIDRAGRSPAVSAVVLRGVGDTFTAGYDLTARGRWDTPYGAPEIDRRQGAWDPVRDLQFMGNNVRRFMSIWHCPKPVLGEIRGWAVGGATDLVLCCDQLYMAEDAHIGYAPSRIYGTPTTMLWVYRLTLEHAKQFLLTGRAIDAATAYRIGLVSHVVPAAELSAFVESEARLYRNIPANQLALNKLLVNQAYENMGLRTTQLLGTLFDGVTRHTEEAYRWVESFADKGFREVIRERDRPWRDYGERPDSGADEDSTEEKR
ncbi:MAG: crotonase/enoyl-CoA hydratase family protein [Pseudomonadales bacterium]